MKVVVTGGTGSVGPPIVRAVAAAGHEVVVVSRRPPPCDPCGAAHCSGDVTRPDTLERPFAGAEVVVHAAAAVGRSAAPEDHRRVTVDGTRNVLAAAARAGARRIVHLSSLAVHAPAPLIREDSRSWRRTPGAYARAKRAAEERVWARAHDFEVVVLRPGLVLGEGDRHVTPRLLAFLERGLGVMAGRGSNRVPCLTDEDLAAAVLAAVQRDVARGPYVLAGAHATTQADLWHMHARAAGYEPPRLRAPAALIRGIARLLEPTARALGGVSPITRLEALAMTADVRVDTSRAARDLAWRGGDSIERAVTAAVRARCPSGPRAAGKASAAPEDIRCAS